MHVYPHERARLPDSVHGRWIGTCNLLFFRRRILGIFANSDKADATSFIAPSSGSGVCTFAKTDVELSVITLETYQKLKDDVSFVTLLLKSVYVHRRRMLQRDGFLACKTSASALASFFLAYCERDDDGVLRLDTFFTANEISQVLNIHYSTVAKITSALQAEGVLAREGRQILVRDEDLLVACASDDYRPNY